MTEDNHPEAFPEKFLYHIWDEQHIKFTGNNKQLKTVSGKDLKIHFQGHYNTMSGADFMNAIIEINDQNYNGDIEIHHTSCDWYNHQHDINPAYNKVVLHVVFKHNHHLDITLNENNGEIEILELKDIISEEIQKLFQKYSESPYHIKEKYCELFSIIRPEFFEKFLEKNGRERLEKKIRRFEAELSFVSIDQLFYQSILESLGYSKNKAPFYLFSKDWKWHYFKQKEYSYKEFVEDLISKAETETKKYNWYLFRIRPCNQPKNRLYQIAPFLYTSFQTSLTTEITKLFSFKKDEFSLKEFKKRIYNTFNTENEFTKYGLGKDRIDIIVINIFIPVLIVYAKMTSDEELRLLCYDIYNHYDGLINNNIDDLMKTYMTEEQFATTSKKAIYQQGLLNIYHKYCLNHLCEICKDDLGY